jgi:hypothetical protein
VQIYLTPSTHALGPEFGYIVSPRTQISPKNPVRGGAVWALDNDCFSGGLDIGKWSRVLFSHLPYRDKCLFVTSPDVVGDYRTTLAQFDEYEPRLHALGYRVALVSQDGLTPAAVPWSRLDALFVGGTDAHKLGPESRALIDAAKERDKWVHIGRVNSARRLLHFYDCDSWDGTTIACEPAKSPAIARAVRLARARRASPNMLKELTA